MLQFLFVLFLFFSYLPLASQAPFPHRTYTIRDGDTFYSLAKRYNVSLQTIQKINKRSHSLLKVGEIIYIPNERSLSKTHSTSHQRKRNQKIAHTHTNLVYTVKAGDGLFRIAKHHAVSQKKIQELNHLHANSILYIGQKLFIPQSNKILTKKHQDSSRIDQSLMKWPISGEKTLLSDPLKGFCIAAEKGSLVYAVNGGQVMWQGEYKNYGNMILVAAHNGYTYLYGGDIGILVNNGQKVSRGEPIAQAASHKKNTRRLTLHVPQNKRAIYFSTFHKGLFIPPPKRI